MIEPRHDQVGVAPTGEAQTGSQLPVVPVSGALVPVVKSHPKHRWQHLVLALLLIAALPVNAVWVRIVASSSGAGLA